MIVSPTKVAYIIMTSDDKGLERKFAAKNRKRNKPGVVLCGSLDQVKQLAQMTPETLGRRHSFRLHLTLARRGQKCNSK